MARTAKTKASKLPAVTGIAARVAEATDRLLAWSKSCLGVRAMRDVVVWQVGHRWRFAFIAPPKSLRLYFRLGNTPKGEELATAYPWNRGAYQSQGIAGYGQMSLGEAFGGGDGGGYLAGDKVYPADILGGIGWYLERFLGTGEESVCVTLIPEPGYPWSGPGTVYYSARAKQWIAAVTPPWMAAQSVIARLGWSENDEPRHAVNWCALAPRIVPASFGRWGDTVWSRVNGLPILCTHSLSLHGGDPSEVQATAEAIMSCGGLLFPSIAVGAIPAPSFIPCVLVIDPEVVRGAVKPFVPRGVTPIVQVYNTDAYTPVTGMVTKRLAAAAWAQLTGNVVGQEYWAENFWQHFYVEGLPEEEANHLRLLSTETAVLREAARRAKTWPAKASGSLAAFSRVYEQRARVDTAERFPFLEAKVSGIVDLSCVRVAIVPSFDPTTYQRFLGAAGYRGPFAVCPTTPEETRVLTTFTAHDDVEAARQRFLYALRAAEIAARA